MSTAVRSHAKVNLGLYIGAPRADGFHSLVTVYQTLELHDVVTVSARAAGVTSVLLTSNDERVPADERNTAWKMVLLALEELGVTAEVSIHIEKRLPVQGGLGAGSANAVAALIGLEKELGIREQRSENRDQGSEIGGIPSLRERTRKDGAPGRIGESASLPPFEQKGFEGWGTRLRTELGGIPGPKIGTWGTQAFVQSHPSGKNKDAARVGHPDSWNTLGLGIPAWGGRRLEIAGHVGSDVPLFLIGGAVLGVDRGQEVYPLPDFEATWCVVAVPEVGVSTPQAFRDWDALCAERGLTAEASTDKLKQLSRAYASAFAGGIPEGETRAGSSGVLFTEEDLAGPQESALVRTGITRWIANDFEQVVFRQQPSLAEIKRILAADGTPGAALHSSLSGSGSALYGLYRTRGDAEAAQARLTEAGVRSHLTRTLPRAEYWRGMLLQ